MRRFCQVAIMQILKFNSNCFKLLLTDSLEMKYNYYRTVTLESLLPTMKYNGQHN
ncbi:MAG TPA: hypothetical protein VK994_01325 [Bacteroidales bacterium]|nr:hypothetical protein [Bacteroidales bacterium]